MNHSKRNDWNWTNKICSTDCNFKTRFKTKWLKSSQNILKTSLYSTVIIDCVWLSLKIRKTKIEKRYSQIQQQKLSATMNSMKENSHWLQQKQHTKCYTTKQATWLNMWISWNLQSRKTLPFNQKQNDWNTKQNNLSEQINWKRWIVRKMQNRPKNCKSWNDDVVERKIESSDFGSTQHHKTTETRTRSLLFLNWLVWTNKKNIFWFIR